MNWRKLIFRNYKAKLAMFALAILLWLFVMLRKEYEQELSVPLQVTHLREGKVILENPPDYVEILFHGRGTTLILLSLFGKAHIALNLDKVQSLHTFTIKPDMVKWAPGIDARVVEIVYPDTVFVRLDDIIEITLRVKPLLSIEPDPDFAQVSPFKCEPESAQVTGPKSILEGLTFIPTQAKTLDHIHDVVSLKLDLIPPPGSRISLNPNAVKVTATVEKLVTRDFTEVPVHVIHCLPDQPGFSEPEEVNVRVRGAKALIDKLQRHDLFVTVNMQNHPNATGDYVPDVRLPEGISLISLDPGEVIVILRSHTDSSGVR